MTATLNRKNIVNLHGNVQMNISIEPDYIYMSKTLFSSKVNGRVSDRTNFEETEAHIGQV